MVRTIRSSCPVDQVMGLRRNCLCGLCYMRFEHFLKRQMTHEDDVNPPSCLQHVPSRFQVVLCQCNPIECIRSHRYCFERRSIGPCRYSSRTVSKCVSPGPRPRGRLPSAPPTGSGGRGPGAGDFLRGQLQVCANASSGSSSVTSGPTRWAPRISPYFASAIILTKPSRSFRPSALPFAMKGNLPTLTS